MVELNFLNAISRIDLKVSVKSDEMNNEQTASLLPQSCACATAELSLIQLRLLLLLLLAHWRFINNFFSRPFEIFFLVAAAL